MSEAVRIQQALFGYDAGHHLLRSSIKLSHDQTRTLAIATDLSGSPPPTEFGRTITGFQLANSDFFALFCTWLAPEMPRPGCVWSHVLLIELSDLARIRDLASLARLFTRPMGNKWEHYGRAIEIPNGERAQPARMNPVDTVPWLAALYRSDESLVAFAPSADVYENIVMALWSQQWPRLRRSFRFSTGSFSDRGRNAAPFDIQISPDKNRQAWGHSRVRPVEGLVGGSESSIGRWVFVAADDLANPKLSSFREFLFRFGADVSERRPAFAKLARIYSFGASLGSVDAVKQAAVDFPNPDDALTLKRFLLSPHFEESSPGAALASLRFLISDRHAPAFYGAASELPELVRAASREDRVGLLELLMEPISPDRRELWLSAFSIVATSLSSVDLEWLGAKAPDLVPGLIASQPSLAESKMIWQLPLRVQSRVLAELRHAAIEPNSAERIGRAILEAGSLLSASEIAATLGSSIFDAAVEWTFETARLPPETWTQSLVSVAMARLQARTLDPRGMAICTSILDVDVLADIAPARLEVQRLSSVAPDELPPVLRLPVAFFLFSMGLKATDAWADSQIVANLYVVHRSLAAQNEPQSAWRLLRRFLPEMRWWEWDRCEKVREAVGGRLRRNPSLKDRFRAVVSQYDSRLAEDVIRHY